jgi:hypothetical protein
MKPAEKTAQLWEIRCPTKWGKRRGMESRLKQFCRVIALEPVYSTHDGIYRTTAYHSETGT